MNKVSRFLVMAGVLFATTRAGTPATSDFVGTWANSDPATRGIVRILINPTGGGLAVRVFGACQPNLCDWGVEALKTYGDSDSDTDPKYATAVYSLGFATSVMTFELLPSNMLEVKTYTEFHDGSGRQPFRMREAFTHVTYPPQCGQLVQERIDELAQQRVHPFQATQGDVVFIVLLTAQSQDSGFFAEAELRAPSGKVIRSNIYDRVETEPLPETGTYTLIVYDNNFRDRGSYVLQLWWLRPDVRQCNAVQRAYGQLIDGAIAVVAQHDFHWFAATQGDKLFITLLTTKSQDSGFFAEAELRAPSGKVIRNNIYDRVETEPLPETGIYTLIVYDNNFRDRGSYALRVERVPR
jgi:predicted small integral membrane protein